jgi:hypothetical protein
MDEIKTILKELLQNADLLRPSQVEFIRSVNKCYRKYKKISDKQYIIIMDIWGQMNEKCLFDASLALVDRFPDVEKIKKSPSGGRAGIKTKTETHDKDK